MNAERGSVRLPDGVMEVDLSTGAKLTYSVLAVCAGTGPTPGRGRTTWPDGCRLWCGAFSVIWGN